MHAIIWTRGWNEKCMLVSWLYKLSQKKVMVILSWDVYTSSCELACDNHECFPNLASNYKGRICIFYITFTIWTRPKENKFSNRSSKINFYFYIIIRLKGEAKPYDLNLLRMGKERMTLNSLIFSWMNVELFLKTW